MKDVKSWESLKDEVYGIKGTKRRDLLELEVDSFKIGLLLREARINKNMTQQELGDRIDKKRSFISRIENDGSSITLSTLRSIVEHGLQGKLHISIELED